MGFSPEATKLQVPSIMRVSLAHFSNPPSALTHILKLFSFLYWLFMAFSLGTFTFLGQGFMAIFRDSTTAQGFGALLIGMSSIFGGIIIRPQYMPSFWIWGG